MSNSKECKFKVGDKVVCVCHEALVENILVGQVYTIADIHGEFVRVEGSNTWLYDFRFTLAVKEEDEMTAEQIRNEILRIETRIEEAKKDIENAEKERNSLVEKLREMGFVLVSRATTNNSSQKFAVGDIVRVLSYNDEYHPENYTNHSAQIVKTDSSHRPYLVEVGGSEFWCTPEEVEKI